MPTETKYSTFGRKLLTAYSAVCHFWHLLEVWTFYILTDHKPLLGAFQSSLDKYSLHETRHLDHLLQFTSDISFIKSNENVLADSMSHEINALLLDSYGILMICGGEKDQQSQQLLQDNITSLKLSKTCVKYGLGGCVWYQHWTFMSLCARNFTEGIVFPHA